METPVYHSGSFNFAATFAEPAFALPYAGATLQRALYHALKDLGLDQSGLQERKVRTDPTNWYFSVFFLSFAAELRLRVDGFEVSFTNDHARESELHKRVLDGLERAVLQADAHAASARRLLGQQAHCKLSSQGVQERIPYPHEMSKDLGTPAGRGIALYFTNPLFTGRASVALDRSVVVDEGLFVQVLCEFSSEEFDLLTSVDNFRAYLEHTEHAFSLPGILGKAA